MVEKYINKNTCYYAHCQAIYGTSQEKRDIKLLEKLGFVVINPADLEDKYHKWLNIEKTKVTISTTMPPYTYNPMDFWLGERKRCWKVAFRALPDGRIPCGIAKEVAGAIAYSLPVFELPSGIIARDRSTIRRSIWFGDLEKQLKNYNLVYIEFKKLLKL